MGCSFTPNRDETPNPLILLGVFEMARTKTTKEGRHPRSDSATAASQAMENAALGIHEPPEHAALPDAARPFWRDVMLARPRHKWQEIDLTMAAELAQCLYDMTRFREQIRAEGDVAEEWREHPAHKLLEKTGRRAAALARQLHCHPEATEGGTDMIKNQFANEAKAREIHEKGGNVSHLIPRSG